MPEKQKNSSESEKPLTTGDMAKLSGSTSRTVRFYEEEGLIKPLERSARGHRLFKPSELNKLGLALDLREAGLSLQAIKALFSLKGGCGCPQKASLGMAEVLDEQLDCLDSKIEKLKCLKTELRAMREAIRTCHSCEDRAFPTNCEACDVVQERRALRTLRVLWEDCAP